MGRTTRTCSGIAATLIALAPAPAFADTGGLAAYLRARAASARHDRRAVAEYRRALDGSTDPVIAVRAFREALMTGDMALASQAATVLEGAGVPTDDQPLLALAAAAAADDVDRYDAAVDRIAATKLAMLAPSLRAWSAWARGGGWEQALTEPRNAAQRKLAAETRALLLVASGRHGDGTAALQALGAWENSGFARTAGAELLAGAGAGELALTLLPAEARARRAEFAGSRPSLAFGTSRTLARLATELSLGDSAPLGVALLRSALLADPHHDIARLVLAASLREAKATEAALAALDDVAGDGALARDAALARVGVLASAERRSEALPLARGLATDEAAERNDWQTYADLLVEAGRAADAVPFYRRIADGDGAAEWLVWMQLGGALEQAGDWPAARTALAWAVKLAPDEPVALNYLGYARLTRGEAPEASTRLLERAHALAPDNASIADSLGWAYHLTGDTRRALPLLERAAAGEPTNAEIAEHLGDAYWTLGRRYEARYAWEAAGTVADAKDKPRLAGKVQGGPTAR